MLKIPAGRTVHSFLLVRSFVRGRTISFEFSFGKTYKYKKKKFLPKTKSDTVFRYDFSQLRLVYLKKNEQLCIWTKKQLYCSYNRKLHLHFLVG